MSRSKKKKDRYKIYLKKKHAKFSIGSELLKSVVLKATGNRFLSSKRIIAGEVNEVYDVKTKFENVIVRISRNKQNRFYPEKWAIDRSREIGIPAPEVLLIDEAVEENRKVFISVETKLAGKPLVGLIEGDRFRKGEIEKIVSNSGEVLAKIHSVTPRKFGRLTRNGIGKKNSWRDFMLHPSDKSQKKGLLELANKAGIPNKNMKLALHLLSKHSNKYIRITPHLLHGDYGPKHILVKGREISGVLDFENAKSGDPVYDLSWWSYMGKHRPPIEWLIEGYEKITKLPSDYELRLRTGRLRIGMSLIWYYVREDHKIGLSMAVTNLQEDLEWF